MKKSLYNWRHQYDPERDHIEGANAAITFLDESLTIQDAPDSDINVLMARMGVNDFSQLPGLDPANIDPRMYGDFTDIPDLKTALDQVNAAKEQFSRLPAKIRARFNNDPWQLHQFVHDPENLEESIRLGLLHKRARPENIPAEPPKDTNLDKDGVN